LGVQRYGTAPATWNIQLRHVEANVLKCGTSFGQPATWNVHILTHTLKYLLEQCSELHLPLHDTTSYTWSVFIQYIINILLWGCENWAIKEHHFLKLISFIHQNIRSILRIKMTQVRDEHIRNTRKIFFNLPDAQNLVAIRSMMYIGKEVVVRSPNQCPPKQMLTAFSNNPRPPSGVIMTNKKAIVNSLHLLLPDIMEETHTSTNKTTGEITNKTAMNKDGELRLWLKIALDEEKWTYHIRKLQQPGVPIQPPNPNRPQ
jgi:hypothetical protein